MQTPQLRHWILLAYLVLAWGWAFYLIAIALDAFPAGHPLYGVG